MDSVRDKDSILMRGDIDEFFKKIPEKITSADEQIKIFSEIDRLYKKTAQTLSTNPSEVFDRDLRYQARKSNLERNKYANNKVFRNLSTNDDQYVQEMNNASKIRGQKYDTEEFLLKNNFFNRPQEEIKQIFKVMMSTFDATDFNLKPHEI
jgi:hypothetical protein